LTKASKTFQSRGKLPAKTEITGKDNPCACLAIGTEDEGGVLWVESEEGVDGIAESEKLIEARG
jgi:hypothetical protein